MRLSAVLVRVSSVARTQSWVALCCALACTGVWACNVADDAQLLELGAVEPDEITLGETLRVRGRGFPTGADCRVRLHGQLLQPGRAPQTVDVALDARALADDEIAVALREDRLPSIALHATFAGEVSVSFVALAGASRVSGHVANVKLELVPANVDVAVRYAHLQHAQQTIQRLGLALEDDGQHEDGLRVRWANEDSIAANAGLRQGDLLTHVDGLRLRALTDFVPVGGATRIVLRVLASDQPREHEVALSLGSTHEPILTQLGAVVSALAVLMLLCVAWLAPRPRRLVRFGLAATGSDAAVSDTSTGSDRQPFWRGHGWGPMVGWLLVASVVWVGFAVAQRFEVSLQLLALAALIGSLHLVLSTSWLRGSARMRALFRELSTLTLVLAPLACAGVIGGSTTLDGITQQQGGLPWQWFAFKAPPLLLACVVFVSACRRLIDSVSVRHASWATLMSIVLSGVGAAVFFGGWQPLGHRVSMLFDPAVLGIVAFTGKAWGLMLVTTLRRERDVPLLSAGAWFGLSLASVVLSLLWIRLSLLPSVELAMGYTLCGASVVLVALRVWRSLRTLAMPLH